MATVKLKFCPSTVADRPGTIVYFITHCRIVRQITTGYKIYSYEWDEERNDIVMLSQVSPNRLETIKSNSGENYLGEKTIGQNNRGLGK